MATSAMQRNFDRRLDTEKIEIEDEVKDNLNDQTCSKAKLIYKTIRRFYD
jgi:hypothetical protein